MPPPIDLTPRHRRRTHSEAKRALQGIVDFQRFAVTFINAKGKLAWLLKPTTVQGQVQALGSVPLRLVNKGRRSAVIIERLPDGRIPMRLDTRLLKNFESLKTVARHEVAEVGLILGFERRFQPMASLLQLLQDADEAGYEAE